MSTVQNEQGRDAGHLGEKPRQSRARLVGIDAARGVALIGLIVIHILPSQNQDTGDPTLLFNVFYGHSAALFALLAGVGLALSSGGNRRHEGRKMAGNRLGLVARAFLIGAIALVISAIMPWDPPAYGILLYYSVFFLMAIPFLHLGPGALFLSAAAFGIVSPILVQHLDAVLPESSDFNHTLPTLLTEPAAVASELLLTGTYPALPYMAYILAGLGIGRLDLRKSSVLVCIAGVGAALTILANAASYTLLYALGGYEQLLATPNMTVESLDNALVFGPETVPNTSAFWLAIVTPHTSMPMSIAQSLGFGLLVTALFILIGRMIGRAMAPLTAMGSMTLTLYSAHLLALSPEVHYDEPGLWFTVHLAFAMTFALIWRRSMGQGPLERLVAAAARNFRRIVDDGSTTGPAGTYGRTPR